MLPVDITRLHPASRSLVVSLNIIPLRVCVRMHVLLNNFICVYDSSLYASFATFSSPNIIYPSFLFVDLSGAHVRAVFCMHVPLFCILLQ